MPRSPAARASLLSRFPCFYTIDSQPWVSKAASGTAGVDFVPLFREERLDSTYHHWEQYQSIVFQAPYQDDSFEELRVADYARTTPGPSEPGYKRDIGAPETKPAPTAASILSLPEELVVGITNHLQLKDLRAFRLAYHKLAQASSYAIAQHMPLDKHIRLTETGLRSFLPVTRNREVARRISTIRVDGRFLVADTHGCSGLEHECRAYPGLADCPVRIERDVVDGCSEMHVRLLAEMFRNLQKLRRIELRGFPVGVADGDGDGGQSFRAWCPMSSWPFRSVVAALRAGGTHVPELVVRELMSSEGVKAVLEPPPTEACPPSCELDAMPWLKSLDIG
ncbi:hypothetical protein SLS58_009900 [Diplodia intermedia]|uniref:F-box domain-containing protein n=1 Tax=Diplodia intermedia TaxID=856260 RepID=A0ABR3TA29_9PEZI